MQDFATLIGTLLGAIIAGGIAILTQRVSNAQRLEELRLNLSEKRTQWATEHEMDQLVDFFELIQKLYNDLTHFRVSEFHKIDHPTKNPPSRVLSSEDARKKFDISFDEVYAKAAFMTEDIFTDVDKVLNRRQEWLVARSDQEGLDTLNKFEHELLQIKDQLADRYRDIVNDRKLGQDVEN